jgi:hypothetical protein
VGGLVVLAIALSGVTEVRGVYRERLYTGVCDVEGVAAWQDPGAPVAELVTDEQGFDVALPPGAWCFEAAYHDDWFKHAARLNDGTYDRACIKRMYETCDFVARLGAADLEGVRMSTTQWHPPSLPCRTRPYTGSAPP